MFIRDFIPGDEPALWGVFHSSIHQLARKYYSKEQLEAWAPQKYDSEKWELRMKRIRPFVAVVEGQIAGYADLQTSGYIDHFYVAGHYAGRGVGTALMRHIHDAASAQRLPELSSDVSLAAEGFFMKHGFTVAVRQTVVARGVSMPNARMVKRLA